MWSLDKFITIDEIIIQYKGIFYCSNRQYMPKKPQKWATKVWYLAYSKYMIH
jgi:hypothetical protein